MSGFWDFALSLAVIVSFVLIGFGIRLAVRERGKERLRGVLMAIAGVVILGNVYLYSTMPDSPEPPARSGAADQTAAG